MDKLSIESTGFPGAIEFLEFKEESIHAMITAISKSLGNSVILSGMEEAGGTLSDGWLIYDNEILPFKASNVAANIVIKETVTTAAYDTTQQGNFDEVQPVWSKRVCEFGEITDADAVAVFAFDSLKRIDNVEALNGNRLKIYKRGRLNVRLVNGSVDQLITTGDFVNAGSNLVLTNGNFHRTFTIIHNESLSSTTIDLTPTIAIVNRKYFIGVGGSNISEDPEINNVGYNALGNGLSFNTKGDLPDSGWYSFELILIRP